MKLFLLLGSVFNLIAVSLGAFGAHALKGTFTEYQTQIYQTAVQYLFIHASALIALGILRQHSQSAYLSYAGWFFIAGIALFSGSLIALAFTMIKPLGAITPLGGVSFCFGWLSLFLFALWETKNA